MTSLTVSASRRYEIRIGAALSGCGEAIAEATGAHTAAVVTDSNVSPLYLDTVCASLEQAGIRPLPFQIPAGEASKCMDWYLRLQCFLAGQKLTRTDTVCALGGGVVGDLAGFAAATYLRGVPFVQLPTSLLAMVDSSVGGKTAIDLPAGKNLCGAFYQPHLVLCDEAALQTLPEREYACGLAEIIKYGLLRDTEILRILKEEGPHARPDELIRRSVTIKRDIVERDEHDRGERQLLNLGHTVGHAVEQRSAFALTHGACVAIGMTVVTRAAVAHGICTPETQTLLTELLQRCGLPERSPYPLPELLPLLGSDKKRRGAELTLVVPEAPGHCRLMPLPMDALEEFLAPGFC